MEMVEHMVLAARHLAFQPIVRPPGRTLSENLSLVLERQERGVLHSSDSNQEDVKKCIKWCRE